MKADFFRNFRSVFVTGLVLAATLASASTWASHFRGGSITWQTKDIDGIGGKNDVVLTVNTAWGSFDSNVSFVTSPSLTFTQVGGNDYVYVNGTNLSNADYTLKTNTFRALNLDPNTSYQVVFTSGDRISELVNNANGTWRIQTQIYLKDGNLAPKIDLPIIMDVPKLQTDGVTVLTDWTYQLSSRDPNSDKLRYRLANIDELGGNSSYTNPVGLAINPNTGLITWVGSGSRANGLYSAGIVAEDVDENGQVKSKTHVDLIFNLVNKAQVTFANPAGIPRTRNVIVDKGSSYSFAITGTAIDTQSLGGIQGALTEPTPDNYLFTPGAMGVGLDPGSYPITFEVRDSNGNRSNNYLGITFIVPDPNAPRIHNLEADSVTYNGTDPVRIDALQDAIVTDANTTDFQGGMLKFNVTFTDGLLEVLDVDAVGNGVGEINRVGNIISYEGTDIGTVHPTLNGQGRALQINFTGPTSIDALQALVRALTYRDTFALREEGDRNLSLFVEDPAGLSSSNDFYVHVGPHPDRGSYSGAPLEAANTITLIEGDSIALSNENISYADPEGDTITFTVSNVTHGRFALVSAPAAAITSFTQNDINLGRIAFVHDGSENAPTYDLVASDGTNTTQPSPGIVNFTNVSDQPPSFTNNPAASVATGTSYLYVPAISDADLNDTHTFTITNKPSWATFDPATGTLSGTPTSANLGNHANISIRVTDAGGLTAVRGPFSILVRQDTDGDGVPDDVEITDGTNPNDPESFKDTDDDGVPDFVETSEGTDPNDPESFKDTDGDGIPDYVEVRDGTDPTDPTSFKDTDGDGIPDYIEILDGTDPTKADTDGDGVPDGQEKSDGTNPTDPTSYTDTDGDGTPDYVETQDGTDPNDPTSYKDTDNDGVPDYMELRDGTDPADPTSSKDTDGDGVPDYVELLNSTDPNDPTSFNDTDGDGVPDYVETEVDGTDPADPTSFNDTDGDGVPDYVEVAEGTDPADADSAKDTDGDGVPDYIELREGTDPTDPTSFKDTDGDGVPDYVETEVDGTDPTDPTSVKDTDGDGIPDYIEVAEGTDPTDADSAKDTDGDGVPDYIEAREGTDPADPTSAKDSDGDGVPDYVETRNGTDPTDPTAFNDTDGDGVPDYVETEVDGTDPADPTSVKDTDGDGIPDYVEVAEGSDPTDADSAKDTDGDGVPDYIELRDGTDPTDPSSFNDADGDGVPDYVEIRNGTDPTDPTSFNDTDGDGVPDYVETEVDGTDPTNPTSVKDTDGDGVPDYVENVDGTNPADPASAKDSDGDGVPDYVENVDGTNPTDPTSVKDSDGDGVPDYLEARDGTDPTNPTSAKDSDGDGVPDYIELRDGTDPTDPSDFNDTDGDGVPDYIELRDGTDPTDPTSFKDSDDDGAPDYVEVRDGTDPADPTSYKDTDGDGVPDYVEVHVDKTDPADPTSVKDSDGDGVPDYVEVVEGTNPNDPTSFNDTDNDGVPDYVEVKVDNTNPNDPASVKDSDGDGVPDYVEEAQGSDPDSNGGFLDTDGDGVPDYIEIAEGTDPTNRNSYKDSDGDGVPDYVESVVEKTNPNDATDFADMDGDGIPDYKDTDNDNDGISDEDEGRATNRDTDGDGIPDYLDLDSDNDGLPDVLEGNVDSDGDGIPDYIDTDSDNDGIPDHMEAPLPVVLTGKDSDKDGIDDALDVDQTGGVDLNNNGIDDAFEPRDTDADGIPDYRDVDSDNDGIPDRIEADMIPLSGVDSDGDGIDDFLDVDQTGGVDLNNNGIDDEFEPRDRDGDGLPDYLDRDSDNDGIADGVEAGASGRDSDGDGIDDAFDVDQTGGVDANGDGIDDAVTPRDSDGDGIPDYLDLDSDNDGIYDVVEAGLKDDNWDGMADDGVITTTPRDRDGDGIPDYLDLDSNNDGIFDVVDAGFGRFDENKDGRIDDTTDVDGDGIPDVIDYDIGSFGGSLDSDGDGIPDALDLDDDNDGIPDWVENGFSSPTETSPDRDSDGDGIPDRLDLDSDNDGIPDIIESGLRFLLDADRDGRIDNFIDGDRNGLHDAVDLFQRALDTDGDGVPDFQDLDSDGDGIWDLIEAGISRALDANNDGRIDVFIDLDRDGIADSVDAVVVGGTAGTPPSIRDTDGDGIPDYLDLDSDNDGFPDALENGDFNNDGIPDNEQNEGELKTAVRGAGSMNNVLLGLLVLLGLPRVLRARTAPLKGGLLAILVGASVQAQAVDAETCSIVSAANDGCWYVGAGVGLSHLDPEGSVNGWRSDDAGSFGFQVSVGRVIRPDWFWELSYMDAGDASLGNPNPALEALIPDAHVSYKIPALMVGHTLVNDLNGWNLYAKLGVSTIRTEASDQRIGESSQTSTQVAFGVGGKYQFAASPWTLNLALDSYDRDVRVVMMGFSRRIGGR